MPIDSTYLKVNSGAGEAALMHVNNSRSVGATTISVDTVANVPNKFIGTYGTLLPSGFINPATAVNFFGHLSGNDIEIDGFLPGSVDAGNQAGDVVVVRPNGFWANFIATFLENVSNADASALAADVVNTANIVDEAVTTGKIEDGAVNQSKAPFAIAGYQNNLVMQRVVQTPPFYNGMTNGEVKSANITFSQLALVHAAWALPIRGSTGNNPAINIGIILEENPYSNFARFIVRNNTGSTIYSTQCIYVAIGTPAS